MSAALAIPPQPSPDVTPTTALHPAAHTARRPALPALTGLRTLLALTILLFHFTPNGLTWASHPRFTLYPLIDIGYVFVSFFFLISGFILSYNYAGRPQPVNAADFWMARLSRLYPVYALTMAISIPMLMAEWVARSRTQFVEGVITTPLLLQGFFPRIATFWNTIYLFTNPDHLAHTADRYSDGFWLDSLKFTPLPYLCTFLAGLTLGRLHESAQLTARSRVALGLAGFAAVWFVCYHLTGKLPYILVHGGLLTPLFAAIILGLAGPSPLASFFSWRPLVAVGASTYCLYLLHFNVFLLLHNNHVPERLHVAQFDPWISYVFIILLALTVRRWVEHPCQQAIGGWWKRHRAAQQAKPAAA